VFVGPLLKSLAEVVNAHAVGLVVSVGEVEAADVHAGVEHLDEHVDVPAGGTEGADDLDLAEVGVDGLEDVAELDSLRV